MLYIAPYRSSFQTSCFYCVGRRPGRHSVTLRNGKGPDRRRYPWRNCHSAQSGQWGHPEALNYNQVAEVKINVSNFGAEQANGPVVVNVLTKQGGNQFHGELYTYGRTYQLDSLDALSKATDEPKDPDREIYPGGINLQDPAAYAAPGTMYAENPSDNEEPLTDTYSLTLNQQFPWKMNFLMGYVGDNSRFLLDDGSNQTVALDNVNAIPIGGLYKPNPYTGQILTPVGNNVPTAVGAASVVSSAGATQVNQYRPLNRATVQYGAIDVPTHDLFANYNGLQLALTRQTGRIMFNVNYTFSHAPSSRAGDWGRNLWPATELRAGGRSGRTHPCRRCAQTAGAVLSVHCRLKPCARSAD